MTEALVFWTPIAIFILWQWRKAHLRKADERLARHVRAIAYKYAECPESSGPREEQIH